MQVVPRLSSYHSQVPELLAPSLLQIRSRCLIRKGDPVRMLCAIHGIKSSGLLFAIILDSGATSFYTAEGQCVGSLEDKSIPWQLHLNGNETGESSKAAAAKMLQELKGHRRASQTPQRQMKQEWIRNSSITTNSQVEEYAKQRPGLSRFLAVARQL
ncbi:unnamed protein product [Phytophthora fragariaefolia]|uniref:Unnamed protein product n=1 Tax=Phytophthora fragariaefolia TaxID=1490495 RepID=A0A9W6YP39_9STRA|nr:unnamed protein product [Phytophthora fragariaefolia]